MIKTYQCLHCKAFQFLIWNARVGQVSVLAGLLRLSPGLGERSPWLYDLHTGEQVVRLIIPPEEQGLNTPKIYSSANDDLELEILQRHRSTN